MSTVNTRSRSRLRAKAGDPLKRGPLHALPNNRLETLKLCGHESMRAGDYAPAILETLSPLFVLGPDLRVKAANRSFYTHFRLTAEKTENRLLHKLGSGQWNIPRLRVFLKQVVPRHTLFKDFEVTHNFEHIGTRTMLLSGRPMEQVDGFLIQIDDITERIESSTAMRASEIRYRRLFEAARDGILIMDPATRKITDANPFMTELLGYSHHQLLGKELWEIGLLHDEKASQAAFQELRTKHFIRYEDLPLQTKAGQRHEVEFVSNLYDEGGREVIQCNIRDITERKRDERELRAAKEVISRHASRLKEVVNERTGQLRETIRELEGFSYSVSHDMRAPLRAMQGYASYLVEEYASKLDEKGINYLHQIMRSAVRLDRLIQDVLSYTTILHSPLPMEPVNLDRLVRDIIATSPNGHPVKPCIEIKGKLPKVMGNEALLTQCVSNLLSNGTKFISPGITPHLEISAQTVENSLIRVWFKDNGIGIAPQDHERIFRLFERIHPISEYEGTGIGLTIVRKAIERMGAQVGFESKLGKGSNFWIELKKG